MDPTAAWNSSQQVHHNASSPGYFRGFVFHQCFSAWLCRWVLLCPCLCVNWTFTFRLSNLIRGAHAPIVCFIPMLWALSISEIAKIVDPCAVEFHLVHWSWGQNRLMLVAQWKHSPCSGGTNRLWHLGMLFTEESGRPVRLTTEVSTTDKHTHARAHTHTHTLLSRPLA